MVHPKTYAYGFCLMREHQVVDLPASYRSATLLDGFRLHYDSRRPLSVADIRSGGQIIIHGRTYDLMDAGSTGGDTGGVNAAQGLADAVGLSERSFLERLDHLAGRYVVLRLEQGRAWLYNDATGTRSVYYMEGGGAAASHAQLLADVGGLQPSGVVKSSHTWDLSPFAGCKALLPNHRVDLNGGQTERYWPFRPNTWSNRKPEDRVDRVAQLWTREMDLAIQQGIPIRFALSGGADSRCALALTAPWMDQIPCFTYGASKTLKADAAAVLDRDIQLVEPLVDFMHLDHRILEQRDPHIRPLSDEEVDACQRNSVGVHGRWLLPLYLTHYPGEDQLMLRANAFEIARHKWAGAQDKEVALVARQRLISQVARSGMKVPGESVSEHIDRAFAEYGLGGDLHGYLPSDMAYWEYRMGRWASEIYNEIDLVFDSFVPINCRAMLEPLLAYTRMERERSHAYMELTNMTVPVLNFFGMNKIENLYEVSRDSPDTPSFSGRGATRNLGPDGSASTPAGLHPLILAEPGGKGRLLTSKTQDEAFLLVPVEHFRTGHAVYRLVHRCASDGNLFLDLHTGWSSPTGDRSFSYCVMVDDRAVLIIPGAHPAGRQPLAIRGLRVGQSVRLGVLVHKDRERPSWEKASRATISDVRFDAVPHDLPVPIAEAIGLTSTSEGLPALSFNPEDTARHAVTSANSTADLN